MKTDHQGAYNFTVIFSSAACVDLLRIKLEGTSGLISAYTTCLFSAKSAVYTDARLQTINTDGEMYIMTVKDICRLIGNYRRYEIEKSVLEFCIDKPHPGVQMLSRRLLLIDSWLALLTVKEAKVLRRHLVEGISWAELARQEHEKDMPADTRALQRIQKKALMKLGSFTTGRFGSSLDYLIDNHLPA